MSKDTLYDELGQFTAIPEKIIEMIPHIGSDAALLYLYFRYRTNKERGAAWPGYKTMEKDLGWGRHKISENIQKLENNGLIERKKRYGASTIYYLKRPPDMAVMEEQTNSSAEIALIDQKRENETPVVPKPHSSSSKTALKLDSFNQTQINQIEHTRPNGRDGIRKELENHFSEKTGLPKPEPKTRVHAAEAGKLWYSPLREICELGGWDTYMSKLIVDKALERMDGLTVCSPNSIVKVARAIVAESKIGKGELRRKEFHEMTPREFTEYLNRGKHE